MFDRLHRPSLRITPRRPACRAAAWGLTLALIAASGTLWAAGPVVRPAAAPSFAPVTSPEFVPLPPTTTAPQPAAEAPRAEAPADFTPWWQAQVGQPMLEGSPLAIGLDEAVLGTLMHSPQVRVIADGPMIHRTAIQDAEGRFDVRAFAESKYINTDDPVGSTLTTGGPDRWIDQNFYGSAGLRKKTEWGGAVEVSQRVGGENSNSLYFVPPRQGTARLAVSFSQPLLNGAGKLYNSSTIVLADIDTNIAGQQLCKDLQLLLVDVHRNYWDLYLQRAVLLQRRKLLAQSSDILRELEGRREVDVLTNQILRARAAQATREAAVIRYDAGVRNAETRLRNQINDPKLTCGQPPELIPAQAPSHVAYQPELCEQLCKACNHRPEILQATKEICAAGLRAEVAKNELLPVLNMVLESYVSGLDGEYALGTAWSDQFTAGNPSYTAGLQFEVPLGNRSAKARMQQRQLEMRHAVNQLQAITAAVRTEVEVAVRDVTTAYREMLSRSQAVMADEAEIQCLSERWRLLPGDQAVAGVVLDELLSAQERLASAEFDFTTAEVAYHMNLVQLNRATGMLLAWERVVPVESCVDGLPAITYTRADDPPVVMPMAAPSLSRPVLAPQTAPLGMPGPAPQGMPEVVPQPAAPPSPLVPSALPTPVFGPAPGMAPQGPQLNAPTAPGGTGPTLPGPSPASGRSGRVVPSMPGEGFIRMPPLGQTNPVPAGFQRELPVEPLPPVR